MTARNSWTPNELDAIDATGEVGIATRRADGTLRSPRIVWIVRHTDAVYVRSVNGVDAAWYRGVQARHQGELTAGPLQRDVLFVEAGQHTAGDSGIDGAALDDALDEAYRVKYGRSSSAVAHITADPARATTLRVDPVWATATGTPGTTHHRSLPEPAQRGEGTTWKETRPRPR